MVMKKEVKKKLNSRRNEYSWESCLLYVVNKIINVDLTEQININIILGFEKSPRKPYFAIAFKSLKNTDLNTYAEMRIWKTQITKCQWHNVKFDIIYTFQWLGFEEKF